MAKHPIEVAAEVVNHVKARIRADGWINAVTGLGGRRDRSTGARIFGFVRLTAYELDALYHGQDLPAIIVNALPEDAFRLGLETGSPELDQAVTRWRALEHLEDADTWGRLHGWGGIYLGMDPKHGPPDSPLDMATVGPGSLQYLLVLDRQDVSIADRVQDISSPNYGEPRYYSITPGEDVEGTFAGRRVHHTRVITFGGAKTSERQKMANSGFDLSVLQRPIDVLRDVDQTWRSVMCLFQDMSQAVFKIKGLTDMIANGQKDAVLARMEIVDMARSIARAVVIDAEFEDFSHVGAANITGVDPLLMRAFQRLAAAAEMPLTVLLGVSPAGLNATGESDIRLWYGKVQKHREKITPACRRLIRVIARTEGLEPPAAITWPSLWQNSPSEEVAYQTALATAAKTRIEAGITLPEEETAMWVTGATPAESVDLAAREAAAAAPLAEDVVTVDAPSVEVGSVWTDTEDGHRLEVTSVDATHVYFLDLDSDRPTRQWRWALRSFLERSRPSSGDPNAGQLR